MMNGDLLPPRKTPALLRAEGAYWVWRDHATAWELFLWHQQKWWMFGANDYFTDSPGLIVGPMAAPPHKQPLAVNRLKGN